jgi:BMFP domain-containing protein YqiC
MSKAQKINDFVNLVMDALPPGLKNLPQEMEGHLRASLQGVLNRLDLISREEFDAQVGVLQRTREKVEKLELQVKELEQKLHEPR